MQVNEGKSSFRIGFNRTGYFAIICFLILFYVGVAVATSFSGEAVHTYNGQTVLYKGQRVTVSWNYGGNSSSASYSFRVLLGGSTLYSSSQKQGSTTIDLTSTGTLTAIMTVYYSNANPQTYTDQIQVIEDPGSGSVPSAVKYSFDYNTNTLTFSGTGAMTDYSRFSQTPWYKYEDDYRYDIEHVVIGEGITRVGNNSFDGCSKLKTVSFPSTLKEIGKNAFSATRITTLELPKGLEKIETGAFWHCRIQELTLPSGLTDLSYSVFTSCDQLQKVTIEEGLKTIGPSTFTGCTQLREVFLPRSIQTIANNAFPETSVTYTVIRNSYGHQYVVENRKPYIIYQCPQCQTAFTQGVPPTEETPGKTRIIYCPVCDRIIQDESVIPPLRDLSVLYLPDSLEAIEEEAFTNSNSQAIIIPEGCVSIGKNAFKDCPRLIYIKIPSTVETFPLEALEGCDARMVIDWDK